MGAGSEDVVEEEIGVVLKAAIVGMVRCDPGAIDAENYTDCCILSTGINYTRYLAPPSPSSSNKLAWGLRSLVEFSHLFATTHLCLRKRTCIYFRIPIWPVHRDVFWLKARWSSLSGAWR